MQQIYHRLASCNPSRSEDVFVYAIAPVTNGGLAAITSADELILLKQDALNKSEALHFNGLPQGVTSLVVTDQGATVLCAGSDGTVAVFDLKSQAAVARFQSGKPVNTIACRLDDVAIGSDSVVSIWDRRQNRVRWQNTELNDEITALDFHPSRNNLLLAGGDDGVVSCFDTQIEEEQDSLLQAVNHGPIHRSGFLGSNDFYALSSDQNLALHSLTVDSIDDESDLTPAPNQLGDLRPDLPCEYVIDVLQSGPDHVIAAGSHSQSRVDLVKVHREAGLMPDQRIILEAAHNGEVVRSVYIDELYGTIFTAGEDGSIAAYRAPSGDASSSSSKAAKSKKAPSTNTRYKPY